MKDFSRAPHRRWNLRNSFVALQLALSVVLLSVGLLFTRSFIHLTNADPGFDISHTVVARVIRPSRQASSEANLAWKDHVVQVIRQIPGVTSIGTLPVMGEL